MVGTKKARSEVEETENFRGTDHARKDETEAKVERCVLRVDFANGIEVGGMYALVGVLKTWVKQNREMVY